MSELLNLHGRPLKSGVGPKMVLADVRDEGEKRVFVHTQDVAPVLAANREIRDKHSEDNWAAGRKSGMQWVGRIPGVVFWHMLQLGIMEDQKALLKALELNSELKVTNKRLI